MPICRNTAAVIAAATLLLSTPYVLAAQPEGLYSADQLLDADVYTSGSDKPVGEIEDVLVDNNMQIQSFVVEAEGRFGLGGKSYVVSLDQLSVETRTGDKATEPTYRAILDANRDQLSDYPVYNDAWWESAQTQAGSVWETTKKSASDTWTDIKQGTNDLIDRAQGQTGDAADATGKAIDNTADNTTDAASNAADNTSDGAQ